MFAIVVCLFVIDGRNAIGGGLTLGTIISAVIAAFQPTFEWSGVGKTIVVTGLIGVAFEVLPRLVPTKR